MRTALIPFTTDAAGHRTYGPVANVLIVGDDYEPPDGCVAVPSETAGLGDLYDGTAITPPAPSAPTVAQLLGYASTCQERALADVFHFDVAGSGQPSHTVTTRLDDKGQFAMLKVQGWLQLNAGNRSATMPYSNVDFSATTLTAAEADSLVEQAAALDIQSYAILNAVSAGIQANPPTVTARAQVDAAFAALAPAA